MPDRITKKLTVIHGIQHLVHSYYSIYAELMKFIDAEYKKLRALFKILGSESRTKQPARDAFRLAMSNWAAERGETARLFARLASQSQAQAPSPGTRRIAAFAHLASLRDFKNEMPYDARVVPEPIFDYDGSILKMEWGAYPKERAPARGLPVSLAEDSRIFFLEFLQSHPWHGAHGQEDIFLGYDLCFSPHFRLPLHDRWLVEADWPWLGLCFDWAHEPIELSLVALPSPFAQGSRSL